MAYSSLIRCRADNRSTVGKESFYCLSNGEKSIKNISKYIDRYRDLTVSSYLPFENVQNLTAPISIPRALFSLFSIAVFKSLLGISISRSVCIDTYQLSLTQETVTFLIFSAALQ